MTGARGAATVDGAGKQQTPNANGVLEAVPAHARLAHRQRLRQVAHVEGLEVVGASPLHQYLLSLASGSVINTTCPAGCWRL
eukprot:4077487-Pyramimonas_sp.AAC.1